LRRMSAAESWFDVRAIFDFNLRER
jgi:hypothetical protein